MDKTLNISVKQQMKYADKATNEAVSSSSTVIGAMVGSLSGVLLFPVFTMIYTFFLLIYRQRVLKFLIAVSKEENSVTVYDVSEQVQYIVRKHMSSLVIGMLIVSAVCCIAFLVLGVKSAVLLGLVTRIFNLVLCVSAIHPNF